MEEERICGLQEGILYEEKNEQSQSGKNTEAKKLVGVYLTERQILAMRLLSLASGKPFGQTVGQLLLNAVGSENLALIMSLRKTMPEDFVVKEEKEESGKEDVKKGPEISKSEDNERKAVMFYLTEEEIAAIKFLSMMNGKTYSRTVGSMALEKLGEDRLKIMEIVRNFKR